MAPCLCLPCNLILNSIVARTLKHLHIVHTIFLWFVELHSNNFSDGFESENSSKETSKGSKESSKSNPRKSEGQKKTPKRRDCRRSRPNDKKAKKRSLKDKTVKKTIKAREDDCTQASDRNPENVKNSAEKEGNEEKPAEQEIKKIGLGEQYTLFERTAAPARPAVVTDLPINFICEGKPINQTVDRLVKAARINRSECGAKPTSRESLKSV